MIRIVLEESGIDPQRFDIQWVSSAEAARFSEIVTRFTEKITSLGPMTPGGVLAGQAAGATEKTDHGAHASNPD